MEGLSYLDGGPFQAIGDIPDLFLEAAAKYPDVDAIISVHQKPVWLPVCGLDTNQTRLSWTYKQLNDASELLSQKLGLVGLKKGNSIAIFSENYAEWALFCWTAVKLGCPYVSLNPLLATNADELRHVLNVTDPAVVIAMNETIAAGLEEHAPEVLSKVLLKLSFNSFGEGSDLVSAQAKWTSLQDFYENPFESVTASKQEERKTFEDIVLIGLTSGTTSFPKACPQSKANLRIVSALARIRGMGPSSRTLQHAPSHHAMANLVCLCSWANGGTIVYPSAKFDAIASLNAVEQEKCTSLSAVPAMVKAFTMLPDIAKRDLSSIQHMIVAGAPVFPEIVRLCREVLKVPRVSVSWGMTETPGPLSYLLTDDSKIDDGEFYPVGTPAFGMKIKICAPNSRVPLKRGEEGELHSCGAVIDGYLDADNDIFYEDEEGLRWIKTGDMASIGEDGQVRILGRYKDIIIRGGVNIAPANIERRLNNLPGVDSQVVGLPDDMAGEIPVAVLRLFGPASADKKGTIAKLQELALRELGPKAAPALYLDLEDDLHMKMFPMTPSGKVRKIVLRNLVQEALAPTQSAPKHPTASSTIELVKNIWSQVSGISSDRFEAQKDVFILVDSITAMRFSTTIRRQLRKDISVNDIVKNPTIEKQAELLDSRSVVAEKATRKRTGPPLAKDMVNCDGDDSIAENIKEDVISFLQELGLSWEEDVEDVILAPDTLSLYLSRSRPQTWNQRAIFIANDTSLEEFVKAWKATLCHQPLFRSIAIRSRMAEGELLVVIRDNEAWSRVSILPQLSVHDPEELRTAYADEWADPQAGALIKVAFAKLENRPGDTAMIFIANHGVFDNMSANLFFEDMIKAVKNKLSPENTASAPGHTPFKKYADLFYKHRKGPAATKAVEYHRNRLSGIGEITNALWPAQRAPGWYKGCDTGWREPDGTPGSPAQRKHLDPPSEDFGLDGLTRTVKAPGLEELRTLHQIAPYVVLKAAVALFNVHRTGAQTALFGNLEAARYWPFMEDWAPEDAADEVPNPLTVAGPMFEMVLNRIDIPDKTEQVLGFLERVKKQQADVSSNSHAPLFEILKSLSEEDAAVAKSAMMRQMWNWPSGIQVQAQAAASGKKPSERPVFEKFTRAAYDDIGLAWTCGMWDQETFYLNASYDDCQLSKDEVVDMLGEVLSATAWLVANVDKTVGDVVFNGDVGGLIASLE